MSIRDNISRASVGGPKFRLQPDRVLVEIDCGDNLSQLSEQLTDDSGTPLSEALDSSILQEVSDRLASFGFNVTDLRNLGVIVAQTNNLENVVNSIQNARNTFKDGSVSALNNTVNKAKRGRTKTTLGGFRAGRLNFGSSNKAKLEARLRNELSSINLRNPLTDALTDIEGVFDAHIDFTRNTPGPRNLNVDVHNESRVVSPGSESKPHVGDAVKKIGAKEAWSTTSGENAVAAVFDTSFCKKYFQSNRVIDTFSADDVDSAFSDPDEGHGTMTAYGMAGNKSGHELTYNGVAKDADLLLARVSGNDGSLAYIAEAWDWLVQHVNELNRPVISNHSYGVPMCSARSMDNCSSLTTKMSRVMNQRKDHQGFYSAGNEGNNCGHRLLGITNGINGSNSDPTSITCGAFLWNLTDAQSYTSHGFGTCAGINNNPKPDLGCLLPDIAPYGCEQSDMSMNLGQSSGGTSLASPLTAGVATLMASETGVAERSVIEDVLEGTAERVRTTQINIVRNHDARFGHGQVKADKAIKTVSDLSS